MRTKLVICAFLTCSLAYSQPSIDNCHITANLISIFHNPVFLDSINRTAVRFYAINESDKYCKFRNVYGLADDSTSLFSFQLFRKTRKGFSDELKYINGHIHIKSKKYIEPTHIFKIAPHDSSWYYATNLSLLFDITKKGEYKLAGYYKTVCKGEIELHKMDNIFFTVK